MPQVKDIINQYNSELSKFYSRNELDYISRILLEEYAGQDQQLHNALRELSIGMPLQYVLGHTYFHGLKLLVNSNVLIPRPETEELVEWIVETVSKSFQGRVIDIGTGSGCIAIALKKFLSKAEVWAIDKSIGALNVAKKNAALNNLEINFLQHDIFSFHPGKSFDLFVSNPPYIPRNEKDLISSSVTEFEPEEALFTTDEPLEFYRAILSLTSYLNNGGFLFFEAHQAYASKVKELMSHGGLHNVIMKKDISGNDRMLSGRNQK